MSHGRPLAVRSTLAAIALAIAPASAGVLGATSVQERQELVDRIIAVVGDSAVLQSDLQEYIFRLQTQGLQIPQCVLAWATASEAPTNCADFDPFIEQVLDQKISEVLLVIHAGRADITVTESQINEVVDQRLAQIRRGFESEVQFQAALQQAGITAAEFRIQLSEQARSELMTQRYLQLQVSQLQPEPVSDEEIRQAFELQKASLGPKPATVSLKQVIITPKPSSDAQLLAQEKAEKALSRARSGEDFGRLAKEYSDDTVTKDQGGELGWVARGDLVPEFEAALYQLNAGEISDLVVTTFGYHIIKLDRVRGAERFASHILVRPEITAEDAAITESLAEDVATALRSGADPDSLIRAYGDPQEQGTLTNFPRDRLPEEFHRALEGAKAGEVVNPFQVVAPGFPLGKWVVIKVTAMDAGGEWTLDDYREIIRQQIQQEKMLRELVDELRESTYIEVRMESTLAG